MLTFGPNTNFQIYFSKCSKYFPEFKSDNVVVFVWNAYLGKSENHNIPYFLFVIDYYFVGTGTLIVWNLILISDH